MWFEFGKLLETNEIWLMGDDKQKTQLATRFHKPFDGKHKLESKLQARAAGRPSPDRADALVLCFSNYKTKLEQEKVDEKPFEREVKPVAVERFSQREWASTGKVESFTNYKTRIFHRVGDVEANNRLDRLIQQINNQNAVKNSNN
jgi:hypothetical protein